MGKTLLGYIMGNNNSSASNSHKEAKIAAQKFDTDEIHVLRKTWQDLSDRSDGSGIDKETFLQYFPLNGLLGERLFAQFDTKKSGSIDFDDFILGLATVCRGSMDDKIHFVFNMYDVSHDNTVSKQDLTTLLNQIPKEALSDHGHHTLDHFSHPPQSPMPGGGFEINRQRSHSGSSTTLSEMNGGGSIDDNHNPNANTTNTTAIPSQPVAQQTFGNAPGILERSDSDTPTLPSLAREQSSNLNLSLGGGITEFDYEDVDFYTNHDMVEKAFEECDLNHDGRLSYEQFKMWVQRTPALMEYIESILPYNGPKDISTHHHKKDSLPHLKRIASRLSMGNRGSNAHDIGGEVFNHSTGSSHSRNRSLSSRMSAGTPRSNHNVSMQHLSLNLGNVSSSAPHSPMMGSSTHGSTHGSVHGSNHPHSTTNATTNNTNNTINSNNTNTNPNTNNATSGGLPLSRASSFGFPTPTNNNNNMQAGDRFSVDLSSHASTGLGSCLPGEYNLNNRSTSGNIMSPASFCNDGHNEYYDSEEMARVHMIQAMEATQNECLKQALNALLEEYAGGGVITVGRNDSTEVYRTMVSMEAYLWKKGKSMFHMLSKRFYLLSGNCMYYYTHKSDVRPKGVIFLTGFIIERLKDEEMAFKGYYGFEIMHQDLSSDKHHHHEKRVLYCKSEDERDRWVTALQHAAHVVPIEDDYVIGKELGRGRFSIVCECVHKMTGVHCAVKIIDKATIEPEEKGLLRTEIAVLKLVNHPNIIRMEGLYESKGHIYIVMEMLKGGELFERIVGRPRFTEVEAAKLIRPLLESVAYLHDLGIVHRDLKPENILCGEELEDLKIADFGLSKMVLPKEKMDSACGTLSYVAPEVLTMQGYGREADLWSVGVIMFLLLCGKLPFDGEDHNEIIRSTIQGDLKVNPAVWNKLSEEARGLMTALLNKNPKERISARDALRHPYILLYSPHVKRIHHISASGEHTLVRSSSKDSLNGLSIASTPTSNLNSSTHPNSSNPTTLSSNNTPTNANAAVNSAPVNSSGGNGFYNFAGADATPPPVASPQGIAEV